MRTFELFAKNTKDGGFEKYCQAFLSKLGYECELTKESVDGGIDIIANKDGISIGFQCKNKGRNIGSPIVRETEGARIAMGLDKGAILTTATFTKEAKETAEKLGIDLYNWSDIAKLTADMEFEDTEEDRKLLTESVVFEHNEKVYEQLEKHLTEDNKAIVVIGTGLGKTTTALEYCYRHSCRGLVIAPKKIICEDWEQNDCIDAMTFQSFIVQYNDIDYDRYGVVIIDEVHHSGASKWGAGVQHIINNGNKVIGLTATPDRLDGVDSIWSIRINNQEAPMLNKLIAEATEIDFKVALEVKKPKSWLKSVSAFANGIGGVLLFGVADDRSIIGLADAQRDAEAISRLIKERITPLPQFVLRSMQEKGKALLAVEIAAGRSTPYYYSADGVKEAYIRVGNESVPAPDYVLNELILKGTNRSFDALVTDERKEDYSFTLLEATYRERTGLRFESSDYVSFGLTDKNGYLTNAGRLLADQHIVYNSRVFCTRWNGLEKGSIFDDALDDK